MPDKIHIPKYPPVFVIKFVEKLRNFLINTANGMVPPNLVVFEHIHKFWVAKAMAVAAELNIADLLLNGPKPISELAKLTGTHEDTLYRLMRTLAGNRFFKELPGKIFAIGPYGKALSEGNESFKYVAIAHLAKMHFLGFSEMLTTIKTGKSPIKELLGGVEPFEHLKNNKEKREIFYKAMANTAATMSGLLLSAYDFSKYKTIVDVGGAHGYLLGSILFKHSNVKGILFDLPDGVAEALGILEKFGVAQQVKIEKGNFFESVPAGGDAYILKNILHDWDDESSVKILENIRKVMQPDGKVLLLESVIPEDGAPSAAKNYDMLMMVMLPSARERTVKEFGVLLEKAGFKLHRVVKTGAPLCVIEGIRQI